MVYADLLAEAATRLGDEPEAKTQARAEAVARLLARFVFASGNEITPERKEAFIYELQLRRITHAQLLMAEKYILGTRARYGTLTLPDFFPTSEQMQAELGNSFIEAMHNEYTKGFNDGRRFEKQRLEEATGMVF